MRNAGSVLSAQKRRPPAADVFCLCSIVLRSHRAVLLGTQILIHANTADQNQACDIADGTGDHHAQTTHDHKQTEERVNLLIEEAVESGSHTEDTQQRGDADLDDLNHHHNGGSALAELKEHHRAEGEDVGDDEGRDGKAGGIEGGLHRGRLGDGGAGIGGQGHGRSDVGHDAEVEHEKVGSHLGNADGGAHQDGGTGGSHDAVVSGGRHAHAQHDAAQHGEEQSDDSLAAGDSHDGGDELGSQTGGGDAAGHDTSHSAGHSHGDGALAAGLQGIDELGHSDAVILVEEADHDGNTNGHGGAELHGLQVQGDHDYQHHQGQQQIDLFDELPHLRKLILRDTLQAQLLGFQMDGNIDAGEVEDSGQDGLRGHLCVGDSHEFGHQEGSSAHDGGHDLTAGRGRCLNGAGKLRLIARLLHHGDGDRTGGHGVAHGGAGHHAAQGGGDNSHLGGTAGGGTGHGIRQINEEAGNSGALQERAEDDEYHDILGTHLDGGTHDAVGGVEQVVNHLAETDIGEGIDEQCTHHTQDGDAHAAPAQLSKSQDADDGDGHHDGLFGDVAGQLQDLLCVECKVEEGASAQHHNDDVVPRHVVDPNHPLLDGIIEVTDDQN